EYLPPYVIHSTHSIDEENAWKIREEYHSFLKGLITGDIRPEELSSLDYTNDLTPSQPVKNQ
ncbi:MAG: NAD(P)H oxidoreductase, partial [Bacteroidota bacterium]